MNLADVLHRHGEHVVRIIVTQVLLGGEGSLGKVIKRLNRVGIKASLVKEVVVKLDVLVALDHGLLDALELDGLQLLVGHLQDVLRFLHNEPSLLSW